MYRELIEMLLSKTCGRAACDESISQTSRRAGGVTIEGSGVFRALNTGQGPELADDFVVWNDEAEKLALKVGIMS